MSNEAQNIEERVDLLEQHILELMTDKVSQTAENNTNFWKMAKLEHDVQNLIRGQQKELVDEDSYDGIDPITSFFGAESGDTGYDAPFDLANVSTDTFSVKDNGALSGGLWIAGVKKTAIAESATMVWDGTNNEWDATAISANSWAILTIDKTAATAEISVVSTLSDGDDHTEIWPLWYVPWDGTGSKIDSANIIDLRDAIHVMGFA